MPLTQMPNQNEELPSGRRD